MVHPLRFSLRAQTCLVGLVMLLPTLAACGGTDEAATEASSGTSASTGTGGSSGSGFVEQECNLVDDPGGPGQYADGCVRREWVEAYVGLYTSPTCTLTITTPAAGPAAVFELVVVDAALGGTYTHDWEGGTGLGNDSFYRFTTDASFATTKAVNFGVGQKVSDNEERSIGLRVDALDTGTPAFSGYFAETITSPFSNTEAPCGVLARAH